MGVSMKVISLFALLILAGCSGPRPAQPERTQKLPTATEVFDLRTKCAEFGRELDQSLPYGSNWQRTVNSNYSPHVNRCYVDLTDMNDTIHQFTRDLYDGQTRDLLAHAKTDGFMSEQHNQVGNIYVESNIHTLSDCHPGGDCGFAKVNAYIDEKMKRDDQ
jgi:hypothetical protein